VIVDSSALLAVVFREDDAPQFAEAMARAEHLRISAASWFEAAMAVDRRGDAVARRRFDSFVEEFDIRVEAVTYEQAQHARHAWNAFGKGSLHKARLNFGDCLTYGFARATGEPLLFKGNDFAQTDIEPALKS
jgi:ribonuclease VapC